MEDHEDQGYNPIMTCEPLGIETLVERVERGILESREHVEA
jgi:hypothetical protein